MAKKVTKMPSWEWSHYKIKITNFEYSFEPNHSEFLYVYGDLLEPGDIRVSSVNILIYPEDNNNADEDRGVKGSVHQGKIGGNHYELGGILWIQDTAFSSLVTILTSKRTVYFGISVEKIKKSQEMIQSYYFSTQENFGE